VKGGDRVAEWLAPSLGPVVEAAEGAAGHGTEIGLMALSVAVALLGIGLAWAFYVKNPELPRMLGAQASGLYRTLLHKWYVDEAYDFLFVSPLVAFSRFLWRVWDNWIIDGLVNLTGAVVSGTGAFLRIFQTGYVGTYAFWLVFGVLVLLGGAMLKVHP
jgi:NADH-quinone oxidoreductase subunit L